MKNSKLLQKNKQKNIFLKNINNKYKLIPFNIVENTTGDISYFPAASKEWKNSIYYYYSNYLKNLPVYDLNINSLIKAYFNSFLNFKEIYKKIKSHKARRKSVRKIFVSNAEIQHTSSKAIITIYVYDKQRKSLLERIKNLNFFVKGTSIIFIINKVKYH